MTRWKKRLAGFLIAVSALCIGTGLGTVQNVQAATKASYTIKKIQEKKTYKNSKATYYYELPQLKGNSTAVKKINKSLKSYYTSDLKLKEELFRQFADYKKTGFLDANTENLFVKTKCMENYNKNGYIRFVYSFSWHGCGSAESNQTTLIYRLKDGKKVTKVPISSADAKALNLIKGTWYTPEADEYPQKVTVSGKTIRYYFSDSSEPAWSGEIDEITQTNYGYYFKIDFGYNCYLGYQLRLTDQNTLVSVGKGDPYSSEGLDKNSSLSRQK